MILVNRVYFGYCRIMDQSQAIDALSALAHPTRLAVFRLLIARVPGQVPALEIARALEQKPSTLSGHLAVLKAAGLVCATRHQREIRYAAMPGRMGDLVGFLMSDCCGGQINACVVDLCGADLERAPSG